MGMGAGSRLTSLWDVLVVVSEDMVSISSDGRLPAHSRAGQNSCWSMTGSDESDDPAECGPLTTSGRDLLMSMGVDALVPKRPRMGVLLVDWSSVLFSLGPASFSEEKKPLRLLRSLDSDRRRLMVLPLCTPSQPNTPEGVAGSSSSVGGAGSATGARENMADKLRGRPLMGLRSLSWDGLAISSAENVTLTMGLAARSGRGDDTACGLRARPAGVDARFAATASGRPRPSECECESGRLGVGDSGLGRSDPAARGVRVVEGVRETGAETGRRSSVASGNSAPSSINANVGEEGPRPNKPSKASTGLLGVTTLSGGGAGVVVMGRDTARGAAFKGPSWGGAAGRGLFTGEVSNGAAAAAMRCLLGVCLAPTDDERWGTLEGERTRVCGRGAGAGTGRASPDDELSLGVLLKTLEGNGFFGLVMER
jgi:hypothetical protein